MKFYFPLKPRRISIDSELFLDCQKDPNYVAQIKKNGWRIQIHKEGEIVQFFTRHAKLLSEIAKDDVDWEMLNNLVRTNITVGSAIIDGEFLHRRGDRKNTLYVWDIFERNDEAVKLPYGQRKQMLADCVIPHENLLIAQDYPSNFKGLWDTLNGAEDEGIVIKDLNEPLYINYIKTVKSPRQFKILLDDPRNEKGKDE